MLVLLGLLAAAMAFGRNGSVTNPDDLVEMIRRNVRALEQGPGYSIVVTRLAKRCEEKFPNDAVLWIRDGPGRVYLGGRLSKVDAGDLVKVTRGEIFTIEPIGGTLVYIAVIVKPMAQGRSAPAGIRPAEGKMGDVISKSEIDAVIAHTDANAPLHTQDNFTMNFVLFKGRTGPWESHTNCADIYFVQTGKGVIELGGKIENAKEDQPAEPRGTAITGSKRTPVGAGDLIVIPRGVAHHMNPEERPLAYVLIKVWSE
ncbi:MAG: hypothetical protein U0Q16_23180 [Bryobacteraceae bacterium]